MGRSRVALGLVAKFGGEGECEMSHGIMLQ